MSDPIKELIYQNDVITQMVAVGRSLSTSPNVRALVEHVPRRPDLRHRDRQDRRPPLAARSRLIAPSRMPPPRYAPETDSIFDATHHTCTACVGDNGLNDFQTYAAGYFEAAEVLLKQVIDWKNSLTQDTLVYPILFNLRHGIELSIKHTAKTLHDAGLAPKSPAKVDHVLEALWISLTEQAQADRRLIAALTELTPVVAQLHEADPLAQEFRFSENRDGVPSFQGRSVVDLVTVLSLTQFAAEKFRELFWLADRIATERRFGSFTRELNRDELEQLSKALPPADTWKGSAQFAAVRTEWMANYALSTRAFNRAVDFIKAHREFSANIGLPKPLLALNEIILERLLTASLELREAEAGAALNLSCDFSPSSETRRIFDARGIALTPTLVGEVGSVFYLGRDARLSEEFEGMFARHSRYADPADEAALWVNFAHVFEKTNFIECFGRGLRMIGYATVASKFEAVGGSRPSQVVTASNSK